MMTQIYRKASLNPWHGRPKKEVFNLDRLQPCFLLSLVGLLQMQKSIPLTLDKPSKYPTPTKMWSRYATPEDISVQDLDAELAVLAEEEEANRKRAQQQACALQKRFEVAHDRIFQDWKRSTVSEIPPWTWLNDKMEVWEKAHPSHAVHMAVVDFVDVVTRDTTQKSTKAIDILTRSDLVRRIVTVGSSQKFLPAFQEVFKHHAAGSHGYGQLPEQLKDTMDKMESAQADVIARRKIEEDDERKRAERDRERKRGEDTWKEKARDAIARSYPFGIIEILKTEDKGSPAWNTAVVQEVLSDVGRAECSERAKQTMTRHLETRLKEIKDKA